MFKAVTEEVEKLKDAFASANEIFDEPIFTLTSEGMKLLAKDRAGVTVLDLMLKKGLFKEYECDKEIEICVNMQEFYHALKLFKGETTLSLEGDHTIVLSQSSPNRKIIRVRLLEMPEEREEIPIYQLKFLAKIEIKSNVFESVVKESEKKFGGHLMFDATKQRLRFLGKSDLSGYDFRIEKDSDLMLKLEIEEPCHTVLPRDYLERIVKSTPISENMRIEMKTDFPMKISYISEHIVAVFYVAPTVDSTLGEMVESTSAKEESAPVKRETSSKIVSKTKKKTVMEG